MQKRTIQGGNPMRILFVCVHNSARSQMAEAYLRRFSTKAEAVESAGLDPTSINPLVVRVMAEDGIDLSGAGTQRLFDLFREGRLYDYVITVCRESLEGQCPVFPGVVRRLHMPFDDPAAVTGSPEEQLAQVRTIRDQIRQAMEALAREIDARDLGPAAKRDPGGETCPKS
jgi:arsenate reductase